MAAASGPQGGPIQFYYTGIDAIVKALMDLDNAVSKPDMTAAVRAAGKVWQQNFKAEGWLASQGWKPLSEFTRNIREWRGYGAEHPILEQSGGLRKAAADYPATMKAGAKSMSRATTSGGAVTSVTARFSTGRAVLNISGAKVANNLGGQDEGMGWSNSYTHVLPARRFWFTSPEVEGQMMVEVLAMLAPQLKQLGVK